MQINRFSRPLALALLSCALPVRSHATDDTIQPGQWRTRENVMDMANPLLSAEMIAKRKSTSLVEEYCVHSSSIQELLVGKEKAGLCEGHINIAKGRISIQRVCKTGPGKGTQNIAGTYCPTKMETIRESIQESTQGQMRSKVKVQSEWIGACK